MNLAARVRFPEGPYNPMYLRYHARHTGMSEAVSEAVEKTRSLRWLQVYEEVLNDDADSAVQKLTIAEQQLGLNYTVTSEDISFIKRQLTVLRGHDRENFMQKQINKLKKEIRLMYGTDSLPDGEYIFRLSFRSPFPHNV